MKTVAISFGEAFGVLFPIVDPVGNVPTFLAMTATWETRQRRALIRRVVVFFVIGLSIFTLVGEPLLHLFGISLDAISVCIHPQSVVHSLVEFTDGSLKAQLGRPDMRLPIAVALAYPDRLPEAVPPTTIGEISVLEFHELDESRFPSVRLAREAAVGGRGRPAVLNAANEEAVNSFLAGELPFSGILPAIQRALDAFPGCRESLEDILEADRWTRDYLRNKSGTVGRA